MSFLVKPNPPNTPVWWWINLPYATFGIRTTNDIVDMTAPIGKWMINHTIWHVQQWVTDKGGLIKPLIEPNRRAI